MPVYEFPLRVDSSVDASHTIEAPVEMAVLEGFDALVEAVWGRVANRRPLGTT